MSPSVHTTAIVHDGAVIGEGVEIGAFCEVGPGARLGDGVRLHGRVSLLGQVELGDRVEVFPGAVIGAPAQVMGQVSDASASVVVGPRSVLRECVTIHAGSPKAGGVTRVGAECYMMAYSHVGHDSCIGDRNVITNATQIAGHVITGEQVWLAGSVAVHQHTHIGDHAFIAGGAILVNDVIPYGVVAGNRASLQGLNMKGLVRRGFSRTDLRRLRLAYKAIFEGDGTFADRLETARQAYGEDAHARAIFEFIDRDRPRELCLPERA